MNLAPHILILVPSILGCTKSGNHPYEEIAKFGTKLDMKVKILLGIFLATWWNLPILEIWRQGFLPLPEIWHITFNFSF
jgi:hypothetical protein